MLRPLPAEFVALLQSGRMRGAVLAMLTFRSGPMYCWSGIGDLVYGGHTWKGVGTLGKMGPVKESTEIRADGTTVGLSGIDPALYSASLEDIAPGLPARLLLGLFDDAGNLATFPLFSGFVDKAQFQCSTADMSITLNLEGMMAELQRANNSRLCVADQYRIDPTDSSMGWISRLVDQSLNWTPR